MPLFKNDKDHYPWTIGNENIFEFNNKAGLILTLKQGTLTPAGATFIYKNVGKDIVYFGLRYFLQTQLNGKWFDMVSDTFWTLELINLNSGEELELHTDWSNYRFIKEFHLKKPLGETIYLDYPFTINSNQ